MHRIKLDAYATTLKFSKTQGNLRVNDGVTSALLQEHEKLSKVFKQNYQETRTAKKMLHDLNMSGNFPYSDGLRAKSATSNPPRISSKAKTETNFFPTTSAMKAAEATLSDKDYDDVQV